MSDVRGRPGKLGPLKDQQQDKLGSADVVPPLIPQWLMEWGLFILGPATLVALAVVFAIGRSHGAAEGWTLAIALASVAAVLWWYGYTRRRKAHETQRAQALREQLEMAAVDQMGWQEFEDHCVRVLRALSYPRAEKTRGVSREKAVDITAIAPDGTAVAVECKHWRKKSVGVREIRNLHTAVNTGLYKGHAGILMTSSRVTAEAREIAAEGHITVIDRAGLLEWTMEAARQIELRQKTPQAPRPSSQGPARAGGRHSLTRFIAFRLQAMSLAARFTTGVLCCAGTMMILVAVRVATTAPSPQDPEGHIAQRTSTPRSTDPMGSRTVVPASSAVVKEFFAAISKHDWPEVWELGGKNLGRGPYASYSGMIAGYQGTIRDVLITLKATGKSVSGQFLAYESSGAVRTYEFSYLVHDNTIESGNLYTVKITYQHEANSGA